jgi:deferrochelatase/peroxidase EfeB
MSTTQLPVAEASDGQATVEASDVQAIVLRPRPKPYRGEYVVLRIGEAGQGREMLRRILPHIAPAEEWWVPSLPGWLGIAFTFEGLKALGVPQPSLDSFPVEFRQGMVARAEVLHSGDGQRVHGEADDGA